MQHTICNLLPLPDYPRGVLVTAKHKLSVTFWMDDERRDYRETADPTVVWDEEYARWLLFASGDLVGIFGAEMDCNNPGRLLTHPVRLFGYEPSHRWERGGRFHQHNVRSLEGAWMLKQGKRY